MLTSSTVLEIQYRIVLMNLAMMSCHPKALPAHIDLAEGVIQVNDEMGFGTAGGFTTFNGSNFGIDQFGPSKSRQVSEQWGADPTTDPRRLIDLQDLYRVALGLTPLPPMQSTLYLRDRRRQPVSQSNGTSSSEAANSESDSSNNGQESSADNGDDDQNGNERVPIEILLSDVPLPGWFHLGTKRQVPKDACFVGQYGERFAWVTRDGMPELARFTTAVLMVIKLDPENKVRIPRGLAFTR